MAMNRSHEMADSVNTLDVKHVTMYMIAHGQLLGWLMDHLHDHWTQVHNGNESNSSCHGKNAIEERLLNYHTWRKLQIRGKKIRKERKKEPKKIIMKYNLKFNHLMKDHENYCHMKFFFFYK